MEALTRVLVITVVTAIFTCPLSADPIQTSFKLHDHLVVVSGSIDGVQDLHLIIDTGATCTMISKQLSRRLKLKTDKVSVVSWGKEVAARTGQIDEIAVGRKRFYDIEARIGDISVTSGLRVDALIGLDVLRRSNLTIDYENRILTFGSNQEMKQQAVFYGKLPFLPIPLRVQETHLVLILDTGAPHLVLFEKEIENRIEVTHTNEQRRIAHVGGRMNLRGILLSGTQLAGQRLATLPAYLMDVSSSAYGGADGIFSPSSLRLKRLHINFQTHRISWEN